MGRGKGARWFGDGHGVGDGRGADLEIVLIDNRVRADWPCREDILGDDDLKDALLSSVKLFHGIPPVSLQPE
mgnify:CR=1 FL=1